MPQTLREKYLEALKGLAPPDVKTLTPEEKRNAFRKIMEPHRDPIQFKYKDENGEERKTEVTPPAHPYPFENPITLSLDTDYAVRSIRRKAPGAGTAQATVISEKPPIPEIAEQSDSDYKNRLLTGKADPTMNTLAGLAKVNGKHYGSDNVYVNPGLSALNKESVTAHELSHMNKPGTNDWGGTRGLKDDPSAYYAGELYMGMRDDEFNDNISSYNKRKSKDINLPASKKKK